MDKQKEIEKMAHAIKTLQSTAGYYFPTKAAVRMARGLFEAGYGDVRTAVKEFADKVRQKCWCAGNLYGFEEKWGEIWESEIDRFVKEVCGDE